MKKLILATLIVPMALGTSLSLQAADKPADKPAEAKPAETKPAPKFRPFRGKVSTTDKTAKSITLEGEKAQTFLITSQTRIFKDRKPATFDDIMAGDMVGGRAQEKDSKWEAVTINVGIPAAAPTKPKEGEKKPEEPKK
jgi:Cu/Ag efflux protein CusF